MTGTVSPHPFVRPRRVARPSLTVFGLHHAGGSAAFYHPFGRELPPDWDLLLLDLPGRGRRYAEPALDDMDGVVRSVVADLLPAIDGPFALFGHSFGALVATEAGRALSALGRVPVWTGVSGCVPPAVIDAPALSGLGDDDLMDLCMRMGGTPTELERYPAAVQRFLNLVRADLHAVESYRPLPGRTPLPCPLTVFCGTDDPWAPPGAMDGWAAESAAGVRTRTYPGGHFFLVGAPFARFCADLTEDLRAATAPAAAH